MSAIKAWQRLCDKQSPRKCAQLSPIRPIAYHLFPLDEFKGDNVVNSHMWTFLNNEEFYYQNTGSIVSYHFKDEKKLTLMLYDNINVVQWNDRLVEFKFLGQGNFGKVFKARDKITNEIYAIKVLKPPKKRRLQALYVFMSRLLVERNVMSELNRCIFFVRLLAAFQNKDTNFSFVLEFCISDLEKLYSIYPHFQKLEKLEKYYRKRVLVKKVRSKMNKYLSIDFKDLSFMYLFEMLCGLHYLGSRHIVHADIKPPNILISSTGHVKIADLGLAYRNQWIDRPSVYKLPTNEVELVEADEMDASGHIMGTPYFLDPELRIVLRLSSSSTKIATEKHFKFNPYYLTMHEVTQNFLSDLYAVGFTFFLLYFGGYSPIERPLFANYDNKFWPIDVFFEKKIREEIFDIPILKMSKDHESFSVMGILLSLLRPRQIRGLNFLKETTVFKLNKRVDEKYIDISKIENTFYYKSKSMTKENVVNLVIPPEYLSALSRPSSSNSQSDDDSTSSEKNSEADELSFKLHAFDYRYVSDI